MDPREEQVLGKAYDGRLMRRLLVYIAPYRSSAVLALLLIISAAVLSILPPYLTKIAIDRYIQNHDLAGLNRVAALYVGILVAVLGLTYGQTMVMNLMGQKIMYDLRMQIFRHLEALDVAFFDRNPVGRLMTRVTTDVDALNEALKGDDTDAIQAAAVKLGETSQKMGQALYEAAAAEAAAAGESAPTDDTGSSTDGGDDDVVDAEIVDDEAQDRDA